ncbi:uncharacterized protein LOC135404638 [Pseudopipra pipra]|uniref:uncharacterized protein LOC135404638 n=1 Tax=Pseudopipra pipra TaxID=415032 RepID=UPI003139546A
MAGRRFSLLRLFRRKKEEESPGAAPAQQPEEVQQVQPPQEDAGQERTEEQLHARGRFRRAAQLVCRFIRCIWHEEATFMATGDTANWDLFNAQTSAALLDLLVENGVYKAKQVPAIVRCIHQWLMSNVSDEHRLDKTLVLLTKAHPTDVAVTLLRSAPACDRFAVQTVKALLRQLLDEDVLMAIGRKSGWDMLLKADSHHYAVGLLARPPLTVPVLLGQRALAARDG